ncbi:hypothetical protein FJZ31_21280 [Candidatus Poribacteria bacterium]|nr:hypothetical protein [Candidatus Poribacteria bacterium]
MARISEATTTTSQAFQNKIRQKINEFRSFEEAAQYYTTTMYEEFEESIVLARLFATVAYGELPLQNKNFVKLLATSKGVGQLLFDHTPVLSLLGTSGEQPAWNNRRYSRGHVGIPLISADFIDAIPMMSRLLRQLGLGLDWIDSADTDIVKHTMGSMSGVFFVPRPTSEVDARGRKIIAAQDFVTKYHVKTVFGFGGGYLGSSTFSVTIIFLRETLNESQVRQFVANMAFFKPITVNLVKRKLFT